MSKTKTLKYYRINYVEERTCLVEAPDSDEAEAIFHGTSDGDGDMEDDEWQGSEITSVEDEGLVEE